MKPLETSYIEEVKTRKTGISSKLLKIIIANNQHLAKSTLREKHLKALAKPDTVVAITGQQVGLFGGPLFTLYKALTAIKIAKEIESQTNTTCVPIFWLQSEDHDIEEISTSHLPPTTTNDGLTLTNPDNQDSRSSVHYTTLSPNIVDLTKDIKNHLGHLPHAEELISQLENSYKPGESLDDSFSSLLSNWLSGYGIIFFNPRWEGVSELTTSYYRHALLHHKEITDSLLQQSKKLEEEGIKPQVHIRKNSPLFFFHPDNPAGPRYRLSKEGENWTFVGREERISNEGLENKLVSCPECFSASALLRPLIQDSLFPTTAYIAGPAEEKYFRQLSPIYNIFDIEQPLIIPRAKFVLTNSKISGWIKELGLEAKDFSLSEFQIHEKITKKLAESGTINPEKLHETVSKNIKQALELLRTNYKETDKTLVGSVNKTEAKIIKQLDNLNERYKNALITKNEIFSKRLERIRMLVSPSGEQQERYYSSLSYIAEFGDTFVDKILAEIDISNNTIKEIVL